MKNNRDKKAHQIDKHVGSRVRIRRMMLDMSQTDLGKASGVTFQQIQKYEKGINRVSASRLQQFAKILDVTVSFFFEGSASPNIGGVKAKADTLTLAHIDSFLISRDGIHIIKAFHKISERKLRHCVVALVEGIAERS